MYLEQWVRDRVERDLEFVTWREKENSNKAPRETLRAYQLFKLRKILTLCV
ncbi:MAG: hypothetical protein ABID54_03280 [Pseudomonadota bacterium]